MLLLVPLASVLLAGQPVSIGALDLSGIRQGWGTPHPDLSVEGHPLSIGGQKFAHGLGTHSPGEFAINLHGGTDRISGFVGIDDEVGSRGSASFELIADGKKLWNSGVRRGGDPAVPFDVDLRGKQTLILMVGDGGDGYEFDHADWAETNLDVVGAKPTAVAFQQLPVPHIAPRAEHVFAITSPQVVGTRAGNPFDYSIEVAGKGPFTFWAQGLPNGLKLNQKTGRISGKVRRAGTSYIRIAVKTPSSEISAILCVKALGEFALTPPLGWNSYDAFGDDVTESEILANAHALKAKYAAVGYSYVVVDYRWYDPGASTAPNNPNARAGAALSADAYGRLSPAPNRFPSAQDGHGFRALATKIHAMGLKFGIHVMRGIPRQSVKANTPIEGSTYHAADAANTANTCGWCPDMYGVDTTNPAGQAWYDSLVRQFTEWGVDFIKVDDLSQPYSAGEISALHKAIDKCGRSIVFSLSPGETDLRNANHVIRNANMWRISGDFWDNWGALDHAFDLLAAWSTHGAPGHWPDADMIPLGHLSVHGRSVDGDRRTRFLPAEQMTLISLWALAPSPFMLGMNLPDNDAFTEALLTNEEVLAVNQDRLGQRAQPLKGLPLPFRIEIWTRPLADGSRAVGIFNRSAILETVKAPWSNLGLNGSWTARDLWQRKAVGNAQGVTLNVAPHSSFLLKLTKD